MCTVVCRWDPDSAFPVQLLALRDERLSREFDLPGAWWPDQPHLIGGRDRTAFGSWCVSDPGSGVTAVVLNRPERREAAEGAASRGVLPLSAARHGADWPQHLDPAGMASFNLVLTGPDELRWWCFDGTDLTGYELPPGTHLFKPSGRVVEDVDPQLLDGRARLDDLAAPLDAVWVDWLQILRMSAPSSDGSGLLVRRELDDGDSYQTVFAQFIAARPGILRLDYVTDPAAGGSWTTHRYDR